MQAYQLTLPESASAALELMLALADTCPVHVGTTLDGEPCPLCTLAEPREGEAQRDTQ